MILDTVIGLAILFIVLFLVPAAIAAWRRSRQQNTRGLLREVERHEMRELERHWNERTR